MYLVRSGFFLVHWMTEAYHYALQIEKLAIYLR